LSNLFPDWAGERYPLDVYYASRRHLPLKVRTFINLITGLLGSTNDGRKPILS